VQDGLEREEAASNHMLGFDRLLILCKGIEA
jgi:hypothetical protein